VNGIVCGEAVTSTDPPLFGAFGVPGAIAGFSKLIVPSDAVQPGCGTPGATVTFLVDGEVAGEVAWQTGVQRIDIGVQPPPSPSPTPGAGGTPEIGLPVLGGGEAPGSAGHWWLLSFVLGAVALGAVVWMRWVRGRRRGRV
jgi:hypothetical protein